MFSTFTGNSRRPRNVNLSGGAGNPFANTSWSPAAVSNTTKTVSDAQAEREKRQAERQKLRAAGRIQRTWRGHQARMSVADSRRATFDQIYSHASDGTPQKRLPLAFHLLLSFCKPARPDDAQRLFYYVRDTRTVELSGICPEDTHPSRIRRLVDILVAALQSGSAANGETAPELEDFLGLLSRIIQTSPENTIESIPLYVTSLAQLAQNPTATGWTQIITTALATAMRTSSQKVNSEVYTSFACQFLTKGSIALFEENIDVFAEIVDIEKLSESICEVYATFSAAVGPRDELLWLLAHFVHLSGNQLHVQPSLAQIRCIFMQLAALSSEISFQLAQRHFSEDVEPDTGNIQISVNPYISRNISWLISQEGTAKILRDFATSMALSDKEAFQATSLLAGYLLALLQCFPTNADEIRMRLFLEEIPTASGNTPIVKFLWRIMGQTSVFQKLRTESEKPAAVLHRYFQSSSHSTEETNEDQEWRIILLFLELYTFILRLSDDEDFFSAIQPQILSDSASISRIRSCSLSLGDIKNLSVFLKNTAFTLYYRARELSESSKDADASTKSRLDFYLGAGAPEQQSRLPSGRDTTLTSTKLDLEKLRGIISSAVKMLYERDSRKPFLPAGHWLMPDKLQRDDFVTAVIAEEERQREEELADSDDEMDTGGETMSPLVREAAYSLTGQRLSRHARMEQLRAQQMRSQRERRLAEMGPKLEILKHMPFVVPFDTRVMIFRQFIQLDRDRREGDSQVPIHLYARHNVNIRRGQLFEDAFDELYKIGEGLKDQIHVTFVDQFDTPEAGIDGGGVTKEFLTSVTSEAFGRKEGALGMFTSSADGLLYPDPTAIDVLRDQMREQGIAESSAEWRETLHEQLMRYEFLGRVVGKCMYEGILVDLAFAGFFLLKWPSSGPNDENSFKGGINDLRDMDEDLYNGMLRLKNYTGDVSDLGIDFTVEDQVSMPGAPVKTITRRLVANGDQLYVTNDNRLLYISYTARHRLVVQPSMQTTAFLRGLRSIIRPSWLSMFNQSELQRLVGGDSSEIDLEDLRNNTVYSGLYEIGDDNEEHPTIKLFWKVMRGFTDARRRDLLKYVSSTPRAPLLGFSQLRPKFSIRDGGTDENRLPSTSTCVNLLKLPRYTNEATLREKLLYAITSGAGFDLS